MGVQPVRHTRPRVQNGPVLGPAVTILKFLIIFELGSQIFIFQWTPVLPVDYSLRFMA